MLNKTVSVIRVNWALILAFVGFWSYGLYNAVSFGVGSIDALDVLLALGFGFLIAFFVYAAVAFRETFSDSFTLLRSDIATFISYFLLLLPFSFGALTNSLVSDGLSHAQRSHIHAIQFLKALSHISFLQDIPFRNGLFVLGIAGVFGIAAVFWFLKWSGRRFVRLSFRGASYAVPVSALVVFVLFVAVRLGVHFVGGGNEMHPPFRLFPLWLSSSIFFPNAFSFRLPQFLGLLFLMCASARIVREKLSSPLLSWLFGLAVGTIPVLWHVGTLVELSMWTGLTWTLLLLAFVTSHKGDNVPWIRWFALISIAALMRQPAFAGLLLLAFWFWFSARRAGELLPAFLKRAVVPCAPVLLMAPFILKSLIVGTAARYVPGELPFLPADAGTLSRVWFAITSGVAWRATSVSVLAPWVACLGLAFIPFRREYVRKCAAMLAFFCVAFVMFYSVSAGLWGIPRYQAEYVVPFAAAGLFLLLRYLQNMRWRAAVACSAVFLGTLAVFNFYTFARLPSQNPPVDQMAQNLFKETFYYPYRIVSEFPYDYDRAFAAVKEAGFGDATYVAGVTYGSFGQVLQGFSIRDVVSLETRGICCKELAPDDIQANRNIALVLISDKSGDGYEARLREMGWESWQSFRNDRWGSTIVGLKRSK